MSVRENIHGGEGSSVEGLVPPVLGGMPVMRNEPEKEAPPNAPVSSEEFHVTVRRLELPVRPRGVLAE